MAITGISLNETEKYISPSDSAQSEAEGATVFTLGSLDAGIRAELGDELFAFETGEKQTIKSNRNKVALKAVRFGLRGFSNYKDSKGNDIPFKTVKTIVNGKEYQTVSDETLDRMHPAHVAELGTEILKRNSIAGGLEGESQTPSLASTNSQAGTAENAATGIN